MISAGEIRDHLIGRLEPIFGRPKNADGLAETLVKHANERVTGRDLEDLADRLIATRKTKGFPSASELIEAVRALVPSGTAPAAIGSGIKGEIVFDGEIPMVWILADDPRWGDLVAMAKAMEPRAKNGKPPNPIATTSKHAPGVGRFFRSEHVRGVPITDAEGDRIAALYAEAQRPGGGDRAQAVIARVAAGMSMLRASLAPAGTMPKISDRDVAAEALRKRLRENGRDEAALDQIRDAPRRRTA